jgi:hypothetical protein
MGKLVSYFATLIICAITVGSIARAGTEVGNGAPMFIADEAYRWTCIAHHRSHQGVQSFVAADIERDTQAKNEAVDKCSAQHPADAEACKLEACTFALAK